MGKSKIERYEILNRTGGKCGYCGKALGARWHIDHIVPLQRGRDDIGGTDDIDNMMAACGRCNRWKKTFSVEEFRQEIISQSDRLLRDSAAFRLAVDFGVVTAHGRNVIFYFERD